MSIRRVIGLSLTFLVVAIFLSIFSLSHQHTVNEIVQSGNLCSIENWMGCYRPPLGGGFPFIFLVDNPNVSVANSLSVEDDFRWYPFILNIWFYFIALTISYISLKKFFKNT